jgi:hypothetical protein
MKTISYFPHDSNASNDPKIRQMRSVYGFEGYGWYWILVESLRNEQEYRLSISGQYVWNAFAEQMHCDPEIAEKFISDCINEFHLFESDGDCFWSESLKRRMFEVEEKSELARQSANVRWANADAMRTQCDGNAIKESKGKEIKEKKLIKYKDVVYEFVHWFNSQFGTHYREQTFADKLAVRLEEFTIDQLKEAALAMKQDSHMMGKNDRHRIYGTLEYISRNNENVDKWLNQGGGANGATGNRGATPERVGKPSAENIRLAELRRAQGIPAVTGDTECDF